MSERPPVSPKAPREEAEALASDESTRLFVTDETTQHSTLVSSISSNQQSIHRWSLIQITVQGNVSGMCLPGHPTSHNFHATEENK